MKRSKLRRRRSPSSCARARKAQRSVRSSQGRGQRGHVLQLAQEVRRPDAVGDEATRQLEEENGKLKKIVADLSLDKEVLQDVIRRKL
jgi:hypothetical protein